MISMVCCARNTSPPFSSSVWPASMTSSSARSKISSATNILPHCVKFRIMRVEMLRDCLHEQVVMPESMSMMPVSIITLTPILPRQSMPSVFSARKIPFEDVN